MRQISTAQVAAFIFLLLTSFALAYALTTVVAEWLPPGDFRGIILAGVFVVLLYLSAFGVYRLFLRCMPLTEGELGIGSRGEFVAQVNILFYLLLFNSLIRTHFVPVPLMRLVYQALGAKLGANTYSAGAILDPALTVAGDNCIIGHDAVVFAHAIEGSRFSLAAVRLGHNVTIGATAVVMSGVHIGNGAIVSAGAVVLEGTQIGDGEIWGGVPARRLR